MKSLRLLIFPFLLLTGCSNYLSTDDKQEIKVNKMSFNLVEELDLYDQHLDTVYYYGTVNFRDNAIAKAYLNYNLITNSILFLDEQNVMLELDKLYLIKNITYGFRTFIPYNDKEVVELIRTFQDGASLLLHRTSDIKNMEDYRAQQDRISKTIQTKQVREPQIGVHLDFSTKKTNHSKIRIYSPKSG